MESQQTVQTPAIDQVMPITDDKAEEILPVSKSISKRTVVFAIIAIAAIVALVYGILALTGDNEMKETPTVTPTPTLGQTQTPSETPTVTPTTTLEQTQTPSETPTVTITPTITPVQTTDWKKQTSSFNVGNYKLEYTIPPEASVKTVTSGLSYSIMLNSKAILTIGSVTDTLKIQIAEYKTLRTGSNPLYRIMPTSKYKEMYAIKYYTYSNNITTKGSCLMSNYSDEKMPAPCGEANYWIYDKSNNGVDSLDIACTDTASLEICDEIVKSIIKK